MKLNRSTFGNCLSLIFVPLLLACPAMTTYGQEAVPLIILIGPPGSGKTTQAGILHNELGMCVISADDLIRLHPQAFEKFKNPQIHGVEPRVDPALNHLVDEALASADRSKGVILDGYPAAKSHGDYLPALLNKYRLQNPLIIHLRVPDDVAAKRLQNQHRPDLEQELKDYHREIEFARVYFPQADIREIDGTKSVLKVTKEIRKQIKRSQVSGRR